MNTGIVARPTLSWSLHRRIVELESTVDHTMHQTDGRSDERTAEDDVSPLGDRPGSSFEHRRIVSVARQRLFRRSPKIHIGRYAVERRLGAGGMGEVYLAHDDSLDRLVAIKRVRAGTMREHAQERLRREARALARLSHPNVVQVYEVDEHEGQTFVAMEYIDGQTLTRWLARDRPLWRRILEVFIAAGRGLAAAHDAGIIHRDFKPDNVLLSDDGGVRVADFGLALSGEDRARPLRSDGQGSGRIDGRLSTAGSIIGTIRYMSFEQLCGREVDARSDQFSYCLALYEGLWGESPFSLASALARLSDLEAAKPAVPRTRSRIRSSRALWRIIRRGLSKDASKRWPDMHALLGALESVLHRRRRTVVGLSGVAMVLAAGIAMGRSALPEDPCEHVEHELVGVWDDARKDALDNAVAGLAAEHIGDSRDRIAAGLDEWSRDWLDVRRQTCEAEAERRIEPTYARAVGACLTRLRHRAADLVELLVESSTDSDAIGRGIDVITELPLASACEDELALLGLEPPQPSIVDQVESLRRDIDRAHQLRLIGRVDDALTLAEQTQHAADTLGYQPLMAEALAERARAELRAGSMRDAMVRLEDAIDLAELSRHDSLIADLRLELAQRTLTGLRDAEAGAWWLRRARVAYQRVTPTPATRVRLTSSAARLAILEGDGQKGEDLYWEAISLAQSDPSLSRLAAVIQSNLARVLRSRGEASVDEILALQEAAVAMTESHYGPHHPQTARRLYVLAGTLQGKDPDRARRVLARVVAIWSTAHNRPHKELARVHLILAKYALEDHDIEEATRHATALRSIQEQSLPQAHIEHAHTARVWAKLHAFQGEYELALEQGRHALERLMPERGQRDAGIQSLWLDNISSLLVLGRLDEASAELDELLPLAQTLPAEGIARLALCELAVRRGRLEQAQEQLSSVDACSSCDLEGHQLPHEFLRALVGLRAGDKHAVAPSRIAEAHESTTFSDRQIEDWIDSLGLTADERAHLWPRVER